MNRLASFWTGSLIGLVLIGLMSCQPAPQSAQAETDASLATQAAAPSPAYPEWAQQANIYEVNVRQFSAEGTFAEFGAQLHRLDQMGVNILWFMPIFPISETKRKGPLGSYYAVSSFTETNPEFGNLAEFQAVVDQAHDLGMKVILDWVPNHTGWDHDWITEHPDWYTKDSAGNITDPINYETGESWGWTDVADLNYDQAEMRVAMIEDLRWWLTEVGIDGYRMDVAHGVPYDFWAQCTDSLRRTMPDIFMLAEAEDDSLLNEEWFVMDYAWTFHHMLNEVAAGEAGPAEIMAWYADDQQDLRHGFHMHFITNHDENAWNGTVEERMGEAADALAVLAFTFDGMPLIYSGQEAGMSKRLEFFERDPIDWGDIPKQDFYTTLLMLKHRHKALANGMAGGDVIRHATSKDDKVLVYTRSVPGDQVLVILNLSDQPQEVELMGDALSGSYQDLFSQTTVELVDRQAMALTPWSYQVLTRTVE